MYKVQLWYLAGSGFRLGAILVFLAGLPSVDYEVRERSGLKSYQPGYYAQADQGCEVFGLARFYLCYGDVDDRLGQQAGTCERCDGGKYSVTACRFGVECLVAF